MLQDCDCVRRERGAPTVLGPIPPPGLKLTTDGQWALIDGWVWVNNQVEGWYATRRCSLCFPYAIWLHSTSRVLITDAPSDTPGLDFMKAQVIARNASTPGPGTGPRSP